MPDNPRSPSPVDEFGRARVPRTKDSDDSGRRGRPKSRSPRFVPVSPLTSTPNLFFPPPPSPGCSPQSLCVVTALGTAEAGAEAHLPIRARPAHPVPRLHRGLDHGRRVALEGGHGRGRLAAVGVPIDHGRHVGGRGPDPRGSVAAARPRPGEIATQETDGEALILCPLSAPAFLAVVAVARWLAPLTRSGWCAGMGTTGAGEPGEIMTTEAAVKTGIAVDASRRDEIRRRRRRPRYTHLRGSHVVRWDGVDSWPRSRWCDVSQTKLIVKHLTQNVQKDHVEEIFSSFGKVVSTFIPHVRLGPSCPLKQPAALFPLPSRGVMISTSTRKDQQASCTLTPSLGNCRAIRTLRL